jgi:hypothetical protein
MQRDYDPEREGPEGLPLLEAMESILEFSKEIFV